MNIAALCCIILNFIGACLFFTGANTKHQESFNKTFSTTATVVLLLFAALGSLFLYLNWAILAFIITVIPAIIMCRLLARMVSGR
ncbi:MAG: hypothetical protein ABIT58_02240 [Ferruginibacter sp.]